MTHELWILERLIGVFSKKGELQVLSKTEEQFQSLNYVLKILEETQHSMVNNFCGTYESNSNDMVIFMEQSNEGKCDEIE